jgi:hypothetical protein
MMEVVMSSISTKNNVYYPDRPGCVTAYAVLLWLWSGFLALSTLSFFSDPALGPVAAVCPGLFTIVLLASGIGLWRMQPWGWWPVVIIQSIGVVGAVLNLFTGLSQADGAGGGSILGAIVAGAISGGILYWFIKNRDLFSGSYIYSINNGSDGEPVAGQRSASNNNTTTIIVVGTILAVFLVPVIIIAVLTLLGPQIGEVFSQIVNELSAP